MPLAATAHISLVDQAIEAMRALLASGEWPVGARIPPEPVLAGELSVGRNTVREAVRALAHAGVLEVHQGDGTYVAALNEVSGTVRRRAAFADQGHVLEVRQAIETRAASLAAARRTQDDLRRLERALGRRTDAINSGDQVAFVAADVDFHVGVVAAARNSLLAELYDGFVDRLRASLDLQGTCNDDLCADHEALLDAIRAKDSARLGPRTGDC
jgi:DNA-binding FadR family transcriptional regulator